MHNTSPSNRESTSPQLAFRVNASQRIGTGHLMRCLAVAQAWQDLGGDVLFIVVTDTPALVDRLHSEAMQVSGLDVLPGSAQDADQTAHIAHDLGAKWVVVDGYDFDADYQKALKAHGLSVLFVDDYGHASYYAADWVLCPQIYADDALYQQRSPDTQLLLGAPYALLRREFRQWPDRKRSIDSEPRRILVTLGGSDPDNTTLQVIEALAELSKLYPDLQSKVVIGAANRYRETLVQAIKSIQASIELLVAVIDMPSLMVWADIAITAAGGTCWELAFFGVPMVTVTLADNQLKIAKGLLDNGLALDGGWFANLSINGLVEKVDHLLTDPELRHGMILKSQSFVDGLGAERVAQLLWLDTKG
jgi:UDP-2,4-diacetamido-2,4,6-trideoxy-beta-L-altropyranose hydrolase